MERVGWERRGERETKQTNTQTNKQIKCETPQRLKSFKHSCRFWRPADSGWRQRGNLGER